MMVLMGMLRLRTRRSHRESPSGRSRPSRCRSPDVPEGAVCAKKSDRAGSCGELAAGKMMKKEIGVLMLEE
jgi:hypothetical protein